ncbi:RNA-directed DNA polymerase, eukaryota, Reverse transcriptase zinc-binding domain protein [Artemisia annua]|uniref:RNA-directed DNA polymerase, eukaryota, Reverse transcriptase zinc-binding domain protein n=1 Tax=Artemisia annua TaxID=35608 RepID=A0A2U1PCE0_ARTAN|nr:RNA-directed DNA polymerase, eukaryota, Reverse transcriptase zinc-binding domain protein [Artemisia annua]
MKCRDGRRKLQELKKIIRPWINNQIVLKKGFKSSLLNKLADIDKVLDSGVNSDEILLCRLENHGSRSSSCWSSILRDVRVLEDKGFNFLSHCKRHVGNGVQTKFWLDFWSSDMALCDRFPRIFALESVKDISVADKMVDGSLCASFRRPIRDGVERQQWQEFLQLIDSVILSSSHDRWTCDLNGEGMFCVKDIRLILDDMYLPSLKKNKMNNV